jgi:hypothetical protein
MLLRMRKFSDKILPRVTPNIFCSLFFFSKILPFMIWRVKGRCSRTGHNDIIRHMRIAFCVTKTTETNSEYMIMKATNKMQLYRLIYYSKSAVRVLGYVFAHHQEHLTVFTASGNIHQCRCWVVSWIRWNLQL